jgi:hypothetical protein
VSGQFEFWLRKKCAGNAAKRDVFGFTLFTVIQTKIWKKVMRC